MNDNVSKIVRNIESVGKYLSTTLLAVSKELQPFFEQISQEYIVNQDEFEKASKRLMEKGYFLPLTSTPKDYIRMDRACSDDNDLEKYYIDYLEDKHIIIDLIEAFSKEDMSQEWHKPIKQSYFLIKKYGIDESYPLMLPFYYSFFEFLVRDKIKKRGKDLWGIHPIIKKTNEDIWKDKNLDENTKRYFVDIMNGFYKYFFRKFTEPSDISRNSVLHGYSTPVNWSKVDFYKIISGTSLLMYILVW